MSNLNQSLIKMSKTKKFQEDINYLCMLKSRWSSEKEYEDFNEYVKCIKQNIKSFKVKNVQKSFTVFFEMEGIDLKLKLTNKKYSIVKA
jgi:hypothetical protein